MEIIILNCGNMALHLFQFFCKVSFMVLFLFSFWGGQDLYIDLVGLELTI